MRYSCYFPSKVRQVLSDFAVMIAIVIMTSIDLLIGINTPKLNVPSTFTVIFSFSKNFNKFQKSQKFWVFSKISKKFSKNYFLENFKKQNFGFFKNLKKTTFLKILTSNCSPHGPVVVGTSLHLMGTPGGPRC